MNSLEKSAEKRVMNKDSIFKKCDIRGIYPEELNEDLAYRIGYAIGIKVSSTCIVGGDVRDSTPSLKKSLIQGLINSGCGVIDLGILPTPVFYFAKYICKARGGVMVTASHNPSKHNGFKFIIGDLPVTEKQVKEIRELTYQKKIPSLHKGKSERRELFPYYSKWIKKRFSHLPSLIKQKGGIKVVVDAGNGCWDAYAGSILRSLGFQVFPLFWEQNGKFPNRSPDSALENSLWAVKDKVKKEKADLGIAFDGDGDRVSFIDEEGLFAIPDKIIALMSKEILTRKSKVFINKVVYDIKCSRVVSETVKKFGGIPLMEKSGHTFIKRRLIQERAIFGGEISGHFFFGELGRDDALFASLFCAQILLEKKKSLSSMISLLPSYLITPDIRIRYEKKDRETLVDKVKLALKKEYPVEELDGIRVEFKEGWGLMRASVTEPLLTFRFEAKEKKDLQSILNRFIPHLPDEIKEKIKAKVQEELV